MFSFSFCYQDIVYLQKLKEDLKEGGMTKLEQHTLERFFMMTYPIPQSKGNNQNQTSPQSISFFGIDWSGRGESAYLYKRILSRKVSQRYVHLIVDIGANDGLFGSNSINFIQWGWDAILVEPQPQQIQNAQLNTKRYVNNDIIMGMCV